MTRLWRWLAERLRAELQTDSDAPTQADTERERRAALLKDANDVLSSAAKWLIAALGAIGAVLVAGSQLSTIGSLPLGSRFVSAVVGLTVGLAAVLFSIWRVVELLTFDRLTIRQLAADWHRFSSHSSTGIRGWFARRRYPVVEWFRNNPEYLAGFDSPGELLDQWSSADDPYPQETLKAINDMVSLANYRLAKHRFTLARNKIAVAMLLAAGGITVFAWAANPGKAPAPSLRNANLAGADLRGVSLVNADLTGADFTGSNLRGANLKGATVANVIWSNTKCPDGVNSNDTAGAHGKQSCEGHLEP